MMRIQFDLQDESISDIDWWFNDFAEFEDFVGIGEVRVKKLAADLKGKVHDYVINRLLKANALPHGPCNAKEDFDPID